MHFSVITHSRLSDTLNTVLFVKSEVLTANLKILFTIKQHHISPHYWKFQFCLFLIWFNSETTGHWNKVWMHKEMCKFKLIMKYCNLPLLTWQINYKIIIYTILWGSVEPNALVSLLQLHYLYPKNTTLFYHGFKSCEPATEGSKIQHQNMHIILESFSWCTSHLC
jgi:hypothetical protein